MEADLMVTCPYNPAHRIRKYKLMNHIAKCKKSSKVENKAVCPLDKSHIVDRDHLREHVESCSSIGKLIDAQIKPAESKTDIEPPLVNKYMLTENWDEEPEVPTYNAMEVSAKKPVIRCVSGLSKSEKRKFKENERIRIANLRGFHTASAASSSVKDTVHELPLRPPRDLAESLCNTCVLQDDFNKSTDIHDQDASMQAKLVPETHHNSFHRMLYDELAPKDDNTKQFEHTLRSTDMGIRDYLQHIKRENGNIPFSNQNQETQVKKTEIDATCDLFNVSDRIKVKDECISNTSGMHSERVADKLLALLKRENDSGIKKVQPVEETIDIDQINKDSGETGSSWDEIFNKFNERLAYLTDIQNTAAEESAQLLKQLKDLKLREEAALKK